MKIAVRGGHNFQAKGASALICETTEDRKVKDSVVKYLKELGHDVLDVTPGNMSVNADLAYGVNRANDWGAQLFLSIHFNKAYHSYNGEIGTECWTINSTTAANIVADRICSKLASVGFKNRGAKHKEFYELKYTTMSAVIIEVCFVEATKDVAIYKKVGADRIGKLIAEGSTNQVIVTSPTQTTGLKRVKIDGKQYGAYSNIDNILKAVKDNINAKKIEIEQV